MKQLFFVAVVCLTASHAEAALFPLVDFTSAGGFFTEVGHPPTPEAPTEFGFSFQITDGARWQSWNDTITAADIGRVFELDITAIWSDALWESPQTAVTAWTNIAGDAQQSPPLSEILDTVGPGFGGRFSWVVHEENATQYELALITVTIDNWFSSASPQVLTYGGSLTARLYADDGLPVPEPASWLMLLAGCGHFVVRRR